MPKYEIPKFSTEELLAAFGSQVSPAGVLKAGREGFESGVDLAAKIQEIKARKLKQQKDIEEIERKLAAQELLAKTIEGKPEIEKARKQVAQFGAQPLLKQPIKLTTGKEVIPTREQTPEGAKVVKASEEAITQQEKMGQVLGAGVRAGYGEEVFKQMIGGKEAKELPKFGEKGFQQSTVMITGPDGKPSTISVGFDVATGKFVNPMTGQAIQNEVELNKLLPRGYALNYNFVGRTLDNTPIQQESKTGKLFASGKEYIGIVYPKLENAPSSAVESISNLRVSKDTLDQLKNRFSTDFVGPIAGRYRGFAMRAGFLNDPQAVEFKMLLASYKNAMIKAITGAQMSEPEARRLVQQMPNDNLPPEVFMRQLETAQLQADTAIAAKLSALEKSGYVMKDALTEEQAARLVDERMGKISTEITTPQEMQIDQNALDAELKRRGL